MHRRSRTASCATPPALVVDLTQIENSPLHRFVGSQAMVFDDAEIAMILAVFFAVDAAQKHAKRRVPDLRLQGKILGLHSTVFSDTHDDNATLKHENDRKKTEKCPQLRRLG